MGQPEGNRMRRTRVGVYTPDCQACRCPRSPWVAPAGLPGTAEGRADLKQRTAAGEGGAAKVGEPHIAAAADHTEMGVAAGRMLLRAEVRGVEPSGCSGQCVACTLHRHHRF